MYKPNNVGLRGQPCTGLVHVAMVACHLDSYLTVVIHRLDALQHVAMNTQPSRRLPKLLARHVGALLHKAAETLPFLVLYLLIDEML